MSRAGWTNVRFVPRIEPGRLATPVDGIIVSYDPPIFLQRPDLLGAAWEVLKPGGRITLSVGRCTTPAGKIVAPLLKAGMALLGYRENWQLLDRPRTVAAPRTTLRRQDRSMAAFRLPVRPLRRETTLMNSPATKARPH